MRLLVLGLLAALLPAQQREPFLFLRLAGAKAGAAPRVSSNERIPLQICIQAKAVSDSFEQPRVEALNQAPGGPPANVKLSIWKVAAAGRQEVAFRVNSSGGGKDLTVWWVDADFDLLEDKNLRLDRARQFVEWMASQAADVRSQLLQAPGGKEWMAAYFEEQYIRNPPGEYEIVARYTPATVANWKGSLTSAPFRVAVTEVADFFENLKEKLTRH